jgi:transposase
MREITRGGTIDGFWLHRLLCAHRIHNRILDAASILVDPRSRRAKTDRLDAAGLLRTLMALDRGESRVRRVVRVPSVSQEDARRRSRERTRLVVERGQHSNRIINNYTILHARTAFENGDAPEDARPHLLRLWLDAPIRPVHPTFVAAASCR